MGDWNLMTGRSCNKTLGRHNLDASPNGLVGVNDRNVVTGSRSGDMLGGHNLGTLPSGTIGSVVGVGEQTRMTVGGGNSGLTDWDSRLHLGSRAAGRAGDEGSIVNRTYNPLHRRLPLFRQVFWILQVGLHDGHDVTKILKYSHHDSRKQTTNLADFPYIAKNLEYNLNFGDFLL